MNRRGFMQSAVAGVAGLAGANLPSVASSNVTAPVRPLLKVAAKGLDIVRIDRTTVKMPYREVPGRNMARELPHWAWSEICEVELACGTVGFGETLLYYTWGATSDAAVERARGQNAAALMWDDSLGAGLQMALFDAVARAGDVPIHRLFGKQLHERTPVAWWNIDTSPEDMASECRTAFEQGYRAYKTKGRPWFDVWEQVQQVSKAVPDSFHVAIDFNDTLLDADRGIPILKELAQYPQVAIYESPIPQSDIPGNKAIRQATRVPVAMHYGNPRPLIALKEDVCDGFVIGAGASGTLNQGRIAAMGDKPFWLQLVGTTITAAYSLHFGAVLSHATWPAVNCHQLFEDSLLTEPFRVIDGYADIPTKPGLGFELNRDAVERFRVDKPANRPDPPRLIETTWPDGRTMYVANGAGVNFMLGPAMKAKMPYFERGVKTRLVPDDGSERWRDLHESARTGPVLRK